MENESGQVDILDIPEVSEQLFLPVVALRKILENFRSAELLNLSLVNKVWNYETRSVLRDRRSLTAKMNTAGGTCKDLRAFASDLRRMRELRKVLPFSGLTMAIQGAYACHGDWCEESSTGELDQVYEDILHQMDWKHLTLNLTRHWDRKDDCAGFQLMKKILQNYSCVLEEFSLKIESNCEGFIQHFLQDCKFSRLGILKFEGGCSGGDEDLIKALVSSAPNLKVLDTKGFVNLWANLLEGSSAEHVNDHPYCLPSEANKIPESVLGQLRLRQMCLLSFGQTFDLDRFNRIVPILVQKSSTTLSSLDVDDLRLVLLMHYGICLENVRELSVTFYDFHTSQARFKRILKSLDFTHIFPSLRSVRIYSINLPNLEHTMNTVIEILEQGNAGFIEPVNRTVNIKKVSLDWHPGIPDSCSRLLVEMFPDIKNLFIEARVQFVRFWDYWLDLEELDIALRVIADAAENLDSALCGIFPEEVADLRERDEDYLRRINIVPVMPSLSCFKNLKTFKIFFDDDEISFNVDPASMISKVSGLIGFKRRPGLTVTLETTTVWLERALQHMKPYASVQLTRGG